jgi:hypothetical protein
MGLRLWSPRRRRHRKASCLRVCRRWTLLVVSGTTHRLRVVVAQWPSLGGIRRSSSLGGIHRRWARFARIGRRWGKSSPSGWIRPRWSFVIGWDSPALGWIRPRWSSLGVVLVVPSSLGVNRPRWSFVAGLDFPALVIVEGICR